MEDAIARSDVFFFVTTIAVALVTTGVVAVLFYVARILRDVQSFSHDLKEEGELIRQDIADARSKVYERGFELRVLSTILGSFLKRSKERKKKRAEKKEEKKA